MQTFIQFLQAESFSQAKVHPTFAVAQAQHQQQFSQARVMPTFQELQKQRAAAAAKALPTMKKEDELPEGMFDFMKKKPAKPEFKPFKKGPKDSSAYRTDHHYGNGDIEPSTVPVYKPSWQNAR